ncbi:hypothetical protein FRC12_005704 [Ceratobasidium sp. 428]|nr:hypothetical protein FRC12_005704 [Ceratobasidium sp. 428]
MSDESEWSDSEQGIDSQEQTSVLLGIPDGAITDPKDLRDPNVSRLGGKPVRPCPAFLSRLCVLTRGFWFGSFCMYDTIRKIQPCFPLPSLIAAVEGVSVLSLE